MDGEAALSSVLTVGQSDWATGRFAGDAGDFWIRATVEKGTLKLTQTRLAAAYCRSILKRKSRSVVLSDVSPDRT